LLLYKKKDTNNNPPDTISINDAVNWIESKVEDKEVGDLYVDSFSFFYTADGQLAKYKNEIQYISLIDLESQKIHNISLVWSENLAFNLQYECDSYKIKEKDDLRSKSVISKALLWKNAKKALQCMEWSKLDSDSDTDVVRCTYDRETIVECNKKYFENGDLQGVPLKFRWEIKGNKMRKVESKENLSDWNNLIVWQCYHHSEDDFKYMGKRYIFL
jgi:hypothetical protein